MTETERPEPTAGSLAGGVTVKGWRNGLLLILPPDDDWGEVMAQVDARLDEAKARSFWRGAQTTIDCGSRLVSLEELAALSDRIKRAYGLVPIAVVAAEEATRAAGERLALTPYAEMPVVRKPVRDTVGDASADSARGDASGRMEQSVLPPPPGASNALYVPATVRSGQRIVHDGHLVICGDVNAGAEVMAAGDVLVFGTLRGLAHAGCYGDEGARIVAASLRPPQIRIASKIARAPEASGGARGAGGNTGNAGAAKGAAEIARIVNGEIELFPL